MKKTISILLMFVLLVSLCACNAKDPQTGGAGDCDHAYTEKVTKAATCAEAGIKTFTCSKCDNTYTETIEKLLHTFADATCTAPKTCTVCGGKEGEALGHGSFDQGKCTICGDAQPGYKALTAYDWRTAGVTPDGTELDVFGLRFDGENSSISVGFWGLLDLLEEEEQEERLEYPKELYEFDGKKYYSQGFGQTRPMTYTEQGDTVVVSVLEEEVIGTITLERTGLDQYTVTEITGRIIDDTITSCLTVGSIFAAK